MRLVQWIAAAAIVPMLMMTTAAQQAPAPTPMRLTSTSFPDGTVIPNKYTQVEKQTSPALTWTNAPANTQSFVLHVHDLEGSRQKTTDDQLQWLVWNIPASTTSLPEGVPAGPDLKDGSHQTSANGNGTYRGPGTPAAWPQHHYAFEIFALDTKIDVAANAADPFETRTRVMAAIQGHIIGKAVYVGLFHRLE